MAAPVHCAAQRSAVQARDGCCGDTDSTRSLRAQTAERPSAGGRVAKWQKASGTRLSPGQGRPWVRGVGTYVPLRLLEIYIGT